MAKKFSAFFSINPERSISVIMLSVILLTIMMVMLDRASGSFEMKAENSRPNIIVILIDDQDLVLGGLVRKK